MGLLLAAGTLAGGLHGASGNPAASAVQSRLGSSSVNEAAAPGTQRGSAVSAAPAPAARSSPVSLRIPALDLTARVGPLGLKPDDTVQVPKNPGRAGWYRLGPAPGQIGSAVILGHVDSKTGPAVFYRLRSLRAGNKIAVTLADGRVATFKVDRVVTYPNAKFPARKVYGSHGRPTLHLVTCGGRYDHRAGSYTANVVVYTSLVSRTPGRSG